MFIFLHHEINLLSYGNLWLHNNNALSKVTASGVVTQWQLGQCSIAKILPKLFGKCM